MADLPAHSIDLILADLPYGQTANQWDSVIDLPALWEQYKRLLTPKGSVILTASQPFTSTLVASNLPWFKYCLVWEKDNGTNFFNAKHQPLKVHEDIAVFAPMAASHSPKGCMTFNAQMTKGKPYKAGRQECGLHRYHTSPAGNKTDNPGTRCPRSVLRFKSERGLHPTQKPVSLMSYLIETYSNPGQVVLDNCMGSGSTGVAALKTGRSFIGIELDEEYFATASKRIGGEVGKVKTQLPHSLRG